MYTYAGTEGWKTREGRFRYSGKSQTLLEWHWQCSAVQQANGYLSLRNPAIYMGPTVISAAFTTLGSSSMLFFTQLQFFQRMGESILFSLIVMQGA